MKVCFVFGFGFGFGFTTNEKRNIEEAGRQDAGYPSLSPLIRKPVATCAERGSDHSTRLEHCYASCLPSHTLTSGHTLVSSIEREITLYDCEGLAQSCDTVSHKLGQHPTLVRCWAFHCRRTITGLYWGTCRIMKREKYLWTVCRRYPLFI